MTTKTTKDSKGDKAKKTAKAKDFKDLKNSKDPKGSKEPKVAKGSLKASKPAPSQPLTAKESLKEPQVEMAKAAIDPSCSECHVRACYRQDAKAPVFCASEASQDEVAETKDIYTGEGIYAKVAKAAAELEAEYYGRLTRLEETVVFALKMGAKKVGVASCLSFLDESAIYAKAVRSAGLEVKTVSCKVGSLDKTEIGLSEEYKFCPGEPEACCNPALQAKVLNEWGSDVNVIMGLCVGHDFLFSSHSAAPTVTLAVKDRVLGHNPMAAIYTSKLFYNRILDYKKYPKSRLDKNKK
ncbi:MAG: DUF1847 domain-containing protein [Deltaproteobacteria bacterium]|jgi:uncharacterized metal-binding protein|nr:DUF1847 domain-containing protein [Deltaproteobacteria bacterium]